MNQSSVLFVFYTHFVSKRFLHDQTKCDENFYNVDHAPTLDKIFDDTIANVRYVCGS